MSRHRNIRNMDLDDYVDYKDYDDYDDDDYDEDYDVDIVKKPTKPQPQVQKKAQPQPQPPKPKGSASNINLSSLASTLNNARVPHLKPSTQKTSKPILSLQSIKPQEELNVVKKKLRSKDPRVSEFGQLVSSSINENHLFEQEFNAFPVDTAKFKFDSPSPEDIISEKRSKSSLAPKPKKKDKVSEDKAKDDEEAVLKKLKDTKIINNRLKPLINLVIVGHVDSGKSTLMGHLLQMVGSVTDRQAQKLAHESSKVGKSSFKYAWNLDSTTEERERGVTIDVAFETFETETKSFVILDSPGHQDFVPNMITGANKADYGILVVDVMSGGFESGFSGGGQTKEHSILCRSLGIPHLIVAINKMDGIKWSQDRYLEVKNQISTFLTSLGFSFDFVPVSAFQGENILKPYKWAETCLLDLLDRLPVPKRPVNGPLRMMVNECSGNVIGGKIDSGHIKAGDKALLMPLKYDLVIKNVVNISTGENGLAEAGDFVYLTVSLDPEMLNVGNVLCSQSSPVPIANKIQAKVMTFECPALISGISVIFHFASVNLPVTLKLQETIDKQTGQTLKKNPRVLTRNSCAVCDLEFEAKVCVEKFSDCKEFGRFTLRLNGKTIAAGVVIEIY